MKSTSFLIGWILLGMSACTGDGPQPIAFEEDTCAHCHMTISDPRLGAELMTNKGRIYKFDDLICLKSFMEEEQMDQANIKNIWFLDFSIPGTFISSEESHLLYHQDLQTPMGSHLAAFAVEDSLKKYQIVYSGKITSWEKYLESK